MTHSVNGRSEKFHVTKLSIDPRCGFCGSRKEVAGPIWNGQLHDTSFIERVLTGLPNVSASFGTVERIEGMLCVCLEVHYGLCKQFLIITRSSQVPCTFH